MKKRKGSRFQRAAAVLLSILLIAGMVADAVPLNVLAKEGEVLSGNTEATEDSSGTETAGENKETESEKETAGGPGEEPEITNGDTKPNPGEGTEPEGEETNNPETETESGEETEEEPPETEDAEEQLPEAVTAELMAEPAERAASANLMMPAAQENVIVYVKACFYGKDMSRNKEMAAAYLQNNTITLISATDENLQYTAVTSIDETGTDVVCAVYRYEVPQGRYCFQQGDSKGPDRNCYEAENNFDCEIAYVVSFMDAEKVLDSQYVSMRLKVTRPADPVKDGCTFAGWVTEEGGSTAFDFDNTAITEITNIYASWTQDTPSDTNIASGEDWVLDADGKLTIQSDTGMEKWTEHRENHSSSTKAVKSVEISNGVTSINRRAFFGCSNMTSVSIPGSVKNIGSSAFHTCTSLSEITIPEGVTSIGEAAFNGCRGLERISIPESMEDIGSNAFFNCAGLTSITIPEGVTKIGYCSFDDCSSLTEVIMENETPPSLGFSAFDDCKFVTDGTKGIHVPENTAAAYKAAEGWSTYEDNITDGTHDHNWSPDWTKSESHHWHECNAQGCPVTDDAVKDGYGAHVYDGTDDLDCNICGYQRTAEVMEITGISVVGDDLTEARNDQVGDELTYPIIESIEMTPDVHCNYGAVLSWWKKEQGRYTKYNWHIWEEGVYVCKITIKIQGDCIFADALQITCPSGEHWTIDERSNDNKTIVLRSDEIVKTASHIHTLTQKPAKDATCTEAGNTAYYTCNDCGKWFLDEAGMQEIMDKNSVVIASKGHSYDDSAYGYKTAEGHAHTCLDCGAHGDIQPHTPGEAATESTPQTCTVCGYVITLATGGGSGDNDGSGGSTGDSGGAGSHRPGNSGSGGSDNNGSNGVVGPVPGEGGASGGDSGGTGVTGSAPAVAGSTGAGQTRVKQEKEGNIRKEVDITGEDTLDVAISMPLPELADIVLTGTERQQAADGTQVRIVLDVKDASASVSAADKALVEAALNSPVTGGYTLGQYLDINLYKVVGDSRNAITETDGRIAVTIRVPDRLKNTDSTRLRTFAVLRVHNGRVDLLADLDTSEDTVTIATDRFSTYAIIYKDTAVQGGGVINVSAPGTGSNGNSSGSVSTGAKDSEPKTEDTTHLELYATLSMIAGLTYLFLYFTDRRHGMTEETKKEIVSRLVAWAKQGTRLRRGIALAAIFVVLVYYHSIGKKICVTWKEVYGE